MYPFRILFYNAEVAFNAMKATGILNFEFCILNELIS